MSGTLIIIIAAALLSGNPQMRFEQLGTSEGLSHAAIHFVHQDQFGYLWVGTQDGLNRYDGYSFKIFQNDTRDAYSIASSNVRAILEDSDGRLWIGTYGGGLALYQRNKHRFLHYKADENDSVSLSDDHIIALHQDRHGYIWIGMDGGGLNRFDPETEVFTHFLPDDSNAYVTAITEDTDGRLWVATFGGGLHLYNREEESFTNFRHDPDKPTGLSDDRLLSLHADSTSLWIGTYGGGLNKLNPVGWNFRHFRHDPDDPSSLSHDIVWCLYEDDEKNLWAGTYGGGLNLVNRNDETFRRFGHDSQNLQSLGGNFIQALFKDRSGVFWVGTRSAGLSKYSPFANRFKHFRHNPSDPNSLSHDNIFALLYEENTSGEVLWIGTYGGGLNKMNYTTGEVQHFRHNPEDPESIGNDVILSLLRDREQRLWIGTNYGLNLLNEESRTFQSFMPDGNTSVGHYRIFSLAEDRDGYIWLATDDGLSRLDPETGRFHWFRHDPVKNNSLSSNRVRSIFTDSRDRMWVGTRDAGFNLFDPEKGTAVRYLSNQHDHNTPLENGVFSILEDQKGYLWIGLFGSGLCRFNPEKGTCSYYDQTTGLPNNIIKTLLQDSAGKIWAGTNKGLSRFDPVQQEFMNYDYRDGLQGDQFNIGAASTAPDGRLFMGGANGFNTFHPEELPVNDVAPEIVISDFRIFNEPVVMDTALEELRSLRLSYDQNYFSFEFAALDFNAPEKNRYMYILEGVDKDWITTDDRRYAGYTNLDPGVYRLLIYGSNNDGVVNEQPLGIAITITPAFWQTVWFRILTGGCLLAIGYLAYRYRVNNLLRVERTRLKIARDLHDEVSANIGSTVYFAQAVRKHMETNAQQSHKYLNMISRVSIETQEKISDIIWSINPEHDDWPALLAKMKRYASEVLDSKGIRYKIEVQNEVALKSPSMLFRSNIWLIFKEIINNLVRHSRSKTAKILVCVNNRTVTLRISDQGKGFDPEEIQPNNGIKNIYSRAAEINAEIKLEAKRDKGVSWKLKVSY